MTERARLAALRPDELSDEQRQLYDALTSGTRGADAAGIEVDPDGGLHGPFNAMLYQPAVGDALQRLGAVLRYAGGLPDRQRELAILLVAAHHRSQYEWHAHAVIAQRVGITPAQLDAVRTHRTPELDDEAERTVVTTAHELITDGDLADGSYRRAVQELGEAALVELTSLVGYYALLATQLRVFRVPLPGGAPEVHFGPG